MSEEVELWRIEATGNRFALLDGFALPPPPDPAGLAVALGEGREVDGLLLCLPPRAGGDCRMVLHNPDGSRPEACGNGLLCVARFAVERGYAAGPLVRVETDAGSRAVEVVADGGTIVAARAAMGVPRVEGLEERLRVDGSEVRVGVVWLGNPHCVLFVPDVGRAAVGQLGAALEGHSRFLEATNVEFVEPCAGGLRVRVWERGVGETDGCGTGAAASAVVAVGLRRARSPVAVDMPGGVLRVRWDGAEVEIEGAVGAPRPFEDSEECATGRAAAGPS